ncbi:MAG: hypothetical protein E7509_03560 [Ruminococcus sp.]|nr:hypothetical protein [Ruminococcus sp.]
MSDVENQKMNRTLEYYKKCDEYDNAIRVCKGNREYLKKYIIPAEKVEENFKYAKKRNIVLGISVMAGFVVFVLSMMLLDSKSVVTAVAGGVIAFLMCAVVMLMMLSKKIHKLVAEQDKVNAGIKQQMIACDNRVLDLKAEKEQYLVTLESNNLVIIPTKYAKVAEKIAEYIRESKVESVQEAIEQLEIQVRMMRRMRKR